MYQIEDILQNIAHKAKLKRLSQRLTQQGLSKRSGVALGTIKRFEKLGLVSLESLLKIAMALDCLTEFEELFKEKVIYTSLEDALKLPKTPKRGVIK